MPSEPTLFDDEQGTDPEHATARRSAGGHDTSSSEKTSARGGGPNFLVRRAIVVGGVVAVVAAAAIVIGQMIGSGADESSTGAIAAEWNRIVLVDDRSGRVVVEDKSGAELARIESGVRTPTSSAVVGSTLVVAGADTVAVIDLADEAVETLDLGVDTLVGPAGSALTMIAPRSDDGRALLVHGPSGDVIDTDTFATVVGARYEFAASRSSSSGRALLVTDSGNFQSVLFSFDREEPSFFPGLALAVDAEFVVTTQNVGTDATLSVFDHAGAQVATGRTSSVRAGMITDATVVLVTADGAVVTMSTSSGEISSGPQLDIGTIESGIVTTGGDRLIVTGATGTAIVDDSASVIATYDEQRPVAHQRSSTAGSCVTLLTTDDVAEPQLSVVDVTDGAVLAEASGTESLLTDASGCTIALSTPVGFDVLNPDGAQQFRTDDIPLALSLDGATAAAERTGRVVLIEVGVGADDESSDDPIDLGPRGRTVHFTQS